MTKIIVFLSVCLFIIWAKQPITKTIRMDIIEMGDIRFGDMLITNNVCYNPITATKPRYEFWLNLKES